MQATRTRLHNVAKYIKGPSAYTIALFFEQRNRSISVTLKKTIESSTDKYNYKEHKTNHLDSTLRMEIVALKGKCACF